YDVEVVHLDVLVDPARIVPALVVFFFILRGRIGHGEGDPFAVGRPRESPDAALHVGDHFGLAAGRAHQVEIVLARARRGEGDPAAVGRPIGIGRRLFAEGHLVVVAAGG